MEKPKKILIIQLRRIGDVLVCTPLIRALKESFPQAYIAFLTEKESEVILKFNPHLDKLLVLDNQKYKNLFYILKFLWHLRREKFEVVIDLLGTPRTVFFSLVSGAVKRIGYPYRIRKLFYNQLMVSSPKAKYVVYHKLEAVKLWKIQKQNVKLDFFLNEPARTFAREFFERSNIAKSDLVISISPTSRRHFNRWFPERYARVADWLIEQYLTKVILLWGPGEKEMIEEITRKMKQECIIAPVAPTLLELGAILERCDLHLGNDNGTKHIAVAVGLPTFTIYGPHDPVSWTYPDSSQHRFIKKPCWCVNNRKSQHNCRNLSCLDLITVEEVKQNLASFMDNLSGLKVKIEKAKCTSAGQR